MNPIIRILRSFTAATQPPKLPEGQLAANIPDGKLFIGDQVQSPTLLASREAADIRVYDTNVEAELSRIRANLAIKSGLTKIDDISPQFNNANKVFTLAVNGEPYAPDVAHGVQVMLDGVYQYPGSAYIVSGTQIVFYEAPTTGQAFYGLVIADRSTLIGSTGIAAGSVSPTQLDRSYIESTNPIITSPLSVPLSQSTEPSIFTMGNPGTGVYANANSLGLTLDGRSQLEVTNDKTAILSSAFQLPFGSSTERPTGELGYARINTDSDELEFFSSGGWRNLSGGATASPTTTVLDDLSSQFDGTRTSFTLSQNNGADTVTPVRPADLFLFIDGEYQYPGIDFSLNASTISFVSPPSSGVRFSGLSLTGTYVVGTVSPNTISSTELADSLTLELANGSNGNPSLSFTSSTSAGLFYSDAINTLGISSGSGNGNSILLTNDTSVVLPFGSTTDRPDSPALGALRYNSDTNRYEYWDATTWRSSVGTTDTINDLSLAPINAPKLDPSTPTLEGHILAVESQLDGADFVVDCVPDPPVLLRGTNIASVSRIRSGVYEVEFDTPAPDMNYIAQFTVTALSSPTKAVGFEDLSERTVNSIRIHTGPSDTSDESLLNYRRLSGRIKW